MSIPIEGVTFAQDELKCNTPSIDTGVANKKFVDDSVVTSTHYASSLNIASQYLYVGEITGFFDQANTIAVLDIYGYGDFATSETQQPHYTLIIRRAGAHEQRLYLDYHINVDSTGDIKLNEATAYFKTDGTVKIYLRADSPQNYSTSTIKVSINKATFTESMTFSGSFTAPAGFTKHTTVPGIWVPARTTYIQSSDVINNLSSTETQKPLSAAQGKELDGFFSDQFTNNESYVRAVNSKQVLLNNLHCALTLTNTFGITAGSPQQMIGNELIKNDFYFDSSSGVGKNITLRHPIGVWTDKWTLILDRQTTWTLRFEWNVSNDNVTYTNIATATTADIVSTPSTRYPGLHEMVFNNAATKSGNYKYWRMQGTANSLSSMPYVYLLLPSLSVF